MFICINRLYVWIQDPCSRNTGGPVLGTAFPARPPCRRTQLRRTCLHHRRYIRPPPHYGTLCSELCIFISTSMHSSFVESGLLRSPRRLSSFLSLFLSLFFKKNSLIFFGYPHFYSCLPRWFAYPTCRPYWLCGQTRHRRQILLARPDRRRGGQRILGPGCGHPWRQSFLFCDRSARPSPWSSPPSANRGLLAVLALDWRAVVFSTSSLLTSRITSHTRTQKAHTYTILCPVSLESVFFELAIILYFISLRIGYTSFLNHCIYYHMGVVALYENYCQKTNKVLQKKMSSPCTVTCVCIRQPRSCLVAVEPRPQRVHGSQGTAGSLLL